MLTADNKFFFVVDNCFVQRDLTAVVDFEMQIAVVFLTFPPYRPSHIDEQFIGKFVVLIQRTEEKSPFPNLNSATDYENTIDIYR